MIHKHSNYNLLNILGLQGGHKNTVRDFKEEHKEGLSEGSLTLIDI